MAATTLLPSSGGIKHEQKKSKLMKSIITLLAITVLAAWVLTGCNQNSPGNSTDAQSTNSTTGDVNGTGSGTNNMPATNSLPDTNTNMPAGTNQ
jgi:predicted small secreted protein